MRLIWILLFTTFVSANNTIFEQKLYEKVFPILMNKSIVNIYTSDEKYRLFSNNSTFKIVHRCHKADIVFITNPSKSCTNKPIFVKNYIDFKNLKNVVGAFYYRKGRPQLKLKQINIDKFNLKLNNNLLKYVQ